MIENLLSVQTLLEEFTLFDPRTLVGLFGIILAPVSGVIYWRAQVKAKTVTAQGQTIATQGATIAAQAATIRAKDDQIESIQGELQLKETQNKRHLDNLSHALQTVESLSHKTDLTPLVDQIAVLIRKSDERWENSMRYITDDLKAREDINDSLRTIANEFKLQTGVLQEVKNYMAKMNGNTSWDHKTDRRR